MASLLPIPNQGVAIADATTQVSNKPWYDWLVRLRLVLSDAQSDVSTLQSEVEGASTSTSVTVTAATGTITTASATLHYKKIDKVVFYDATVTITTNGTGAGGVQLTGLPFRPARDSTFCGREMANTGKGLTGKNSTAIDQIKIVYYDNTYPGADGNVLVISGFCEVA